MKKVYSSKSRRRAYVEKITENINKLTTYMNLQSSTKYLQLTLVFMCNSALREEFNFCIPGFFASINKIYILARRLSTRPLFYEVFRLS